VIDAYIMGHSLKLYNQTVAPQAQYVDSYCEMKKNMIWM